MNSFATILLAAVAQAYGRNYDGNRFHGNNYTGAQFQVGRHSKSSFLVPNAPDRNSYIPGGIDTFGHVSKRNHNAPAYRSDVHAPAYNNDYDRGYISRPARNPQFGHQIEAYVPHVPHVPSRRSAPARPAAPVHDFGLDLLADHTHAEPLHVDPAHAEPLHVAPVHVDPVHALPLHVAPVHVDPVHVDPVHVDPVHVDPFHVDPVHVDPVQVDPVHVDPVHIAPVHVDPVHALPLHNASIHDAPFTTGADEITATNVKPFVHTLNHGDTNPWSPVAVITPDPDTWYSETQQFSPPKIAFVPYSTKPTFAICEFIGDFTQGKLGIGNFQFAQFPGKPTIYQYSLDMTAMNDEGDLMTVTINTLGIASSACDTAGEEFNPLKEIEFGIENPYADPSRGRIADIAADANQLYASEAPAFVLQNLEGNDSIIGRSLTLTNQKDDVKTCCVIGHDKIPDQYVVKTYPYQEPNPEDHYFQAGTHNHY